MLGLHALRDGAARLMIVLPAYRLLCDMGLVYTPVCAIVHLLCLVYRCAFYAGQFPVALLFHGLRASVL